MPNLGSTRLPPSPISVAEFYDAFVPLWFKVTGNIGTRKKPRVGIFYPLPSLLNSLIYIGIAVSGGVDSMALAALCSDLLRYPPAKQRFDFHFAAFVIDHKARPGSSKEAHRVWLRLQKMGTALRQARLSVH